MGLPEPYRVESHIPKHAIQAEESFWQILFFADLSQALLQAVLTSA